MVLAAKAYYQTATYWSSPVQGGFGGLTFADPIVLDVRWEERVESFTTIEGTEMRSKAVVHTMQSVDLGGYLALGDFEDVADPTTLTAALVIQRSDSVPDLRGLNESYRSFL